jgi:hypothetical protein
MQQSFGRSARPATSGAGGYDDEDEKLRGVVDRGVCGYGCGTDKPDFQREESIACSGDDKPYRASGCKHQETL